MAPTSSKPSKPTAHRGGNKKYKYESLSKEAASKKLETLNKTYQGCIKEYKKFIHNIRNSGNESLKEKLQLPDDKQKYISVEGILSFYKTIVQPKGITHHSARVYINTLHYLMEFEKAKTIDGEDITKEMIEKNQEFQAILSLIDEHRKTVEADPKIDHLSKKTATDIVSPRETSTVMMKLLQTETKWESISSTILALNCTLIRHAQTRKITLGKLFLVKNKNPKGTTIPYDYEEWKKYGDEATMACFLIPAIDQVKNSAKTGERRDIGVGGYRHKRVELCFIGNLAMSLLVRFDNKTFARNMSFLDPEKADVNLKDTSDPKSWRTTMNSKVLWRNVTVFNTNYDNVNKGIKKAFNDASVSEWEKVTHYKKAGIELLSDHGFSETEISQVSHNQHSVLFKNYMCQLPRRPCLALAGWLPGEEFELRGRRLIKLPSSLTLDDWTDLCFPYRQDWYLEAVAEGGDMHGKDKTGAEHFLKEFLPFMAMVILQDGVLWIDMFPQNSAVQVLRNISWTEDNGSSRVWFKDWAKIQLAQVQEQEYQERIDGLRSIPQLSVETAAEIMSSSSMEKVLAETMKSALVPVVDSLQALKASVERKAPEVQGQNTSSTAGSSEQNSQVSEMRNVDAMVTVETENALVDPGVVVQTLDNYGSVENVVAHKQSHRHPVDGGNKFFTKKRFPNKDKGELQQMSGRWSKVKHIYTEIKRLQDENADKSLSDVECARMLDKERGSMTLNCFVGNLIKKHKTKERKPKSTNNGVASV